MLAVRAIQRASLRVRTRNADQLRVRRQPRPDGVQHFYIGTRGSFINVPKCNFVAGHAEEGAATHAAKIVRMHLDHNTVEMTVKEREGRVLDIITSLARGRNVVRMELNSASLEDIFIELTKKEQAV